MLKHFAKKNFLENFSRRYETPKRQSHRNFFSIFLDQMVAKRIYSNTLVDQWLVKNLPSLILDLLFLWTVFSTWSMYISSMTHRIFSQLKRVRLSTVNFVKTLSNILSAGMSINRETTRSLKFYSLSLPLNPLDAPVPYAIFGDFNFRLDAHRLLQVRIFAENFVHHVAELLS